METKRTIKSIIDSAEKLFLIVIAGTGKSAGGEFPVSNQHCAEGFDRLSPNGES